MGQQAMERSTGGKVAVVEDKGTLEHLMNNGTFQASLSDVLPKHLTPERVVKMALVAASRQPLLFKCTKESFLQAIMKSAELGLDCSGTLGRAYLVPYFNSKIGAYECQFIPGYQGLIELARRSGNIARIESRVVYEKDSFTVEYGLDQKLVHTPSLIADRGAMQCVYAIAELMDGSRQMEVMTRDEVEGIRLRSRAKDNGPWKTDFTEMARKTVIRRIAKYLPLSTELQKAFEADDEQFANHFTDNASEMAERTRGKVVEMSERMQAERATDEQPAAIKSQELPDITPDPSIHERPAEDADETETETDDDLSQLERMRIDVAAQLSEFPKARQKDLIAGRTLIKNQTWDELTEFSKYLAGQTA